MFTDTPLPLHAPRAAARLNEGARTFIIYFYSFLCFTRFPLSISLYVSLSTRPFLRVSLYSLYASPFLYKRGTGENGQQSHE